jgi:hypothetical protein
MSSAEFIRDVQSPQFWMGFLPAILVAGTALRALFRILSHLRLIADTPSSLIRSASQGQVELEGVTQMMEGTPIIAPLSSQRCVWYRYTVEEKTEGKDEWRVIESGTSEAIFHLNDGTGRCIIDPDGAKVIPSIRQHWRGLSRRPGTPPPKQDFWDRFATAGKYRFSECRIAEGVPLYAMGYLKSLGSADPGTLDDATRALIRRWKQDPTALRQRFDTDGDGIISPAEWEIALSVAEKEAMLDWGKTSHPTDINLLKKPPDGRLFMLSTMPEHLLKRRYRRSALLSAAIFLLFGTAAAWTLYLRVFSPQ